MLSVAYTTFTNPAALTKNIETSRDWDEQEDGNRVTHALSFFPLVYVQQATFELSKKNKIESR